ncbi:MAG: hypothetical protein Q8R28_06525, partial [Dehalococcoidia bacterium]|nr:hypothetical protein [Dehalococcoidia bacterium]
GLLDFLNGTIELSLEEGKEGGSQGSSRRLEVAARIISLYQLLYAPDNGKRLGELLAAGPEQAVENGRSAQDAAAADLVGLPQVVDRENVTSGIHGYHQQGLQ